MLPLVRDFAEVSGMFHFILQDEHVDKAKSFVLPT